MAFMMERVAGKTIKDIAKAYNCGHATVSNYLAYAREQNIVVNEGQRLVGTKLLPLALAVYERELENGNLDAARDILFGAGILQRVSNVKHQAIEGDETLDAFRDAYFKAVDVVAVHTDTADKVGTRPRKNVALPPVIHEQVDGQPERQSHVPDHDPEDADE